MKVAVWGFIALLGLVSTSAWAGEGGGVKLLEAGNSWVVLELASPSFTVEEVQRDSIVYQRLSIPDMGRTFVPGCPQVPVTGSLVGVSATQDLQVEILQAESEMRDGYNLYPAPKLVIKKGEDGTNYPVEEFCLDQTVYSRNAFYPPDIAQAGETGTLRRQAVARVLFHPVQFNPVTGEIRFYKYIKAKVSWPAATPVQMQASRKKGSYDDLFHKAIINHASLPPQIKSLSINENSPPLVRGGRGDLGVGEFDDTKSPLPPLTKGGVAWGAPDPGYKISIKKDGLYRITRAELEAAGGNLSKVDPATIRVLNQGREIPIYVSGTENAKFDPADYVEFYGQHINTKYTNTNIYWLTYGGADGLRLSSIDGGQSGSATVPAKFRSSLHLEEDHTYWGELPGGADKDLWFWVRISPTNSNYKNNYIASFTLDSVVASGNCDIDVNLQGRTSTATDPDHHTKVYLNNFQIDDKYWDGQIESHHRVSVSQSYLVSGSNTLKVYSPGDTGSSLDEIYLNWIEISYDRRYTAKNNSLEFKGQTGDRYQYEITGFSSNQIALFDITDPFNAARIINTATAASGSGYKLIFQRDEGDTARSYLALTAGQRKSPAAITLDSPSTLSSSANGADYIIITYDDFYDSVQPLADFREQQGLRVVTARITDIYDEFNYGLSEPQAIKNFLKYAYQNWASPPPAYILLMGDATMDYKNNYGFSKINYVPTYLLEASGMIQAPSDNWYVCVDGDDDLPDMFLGRISVHSPSNASTVVNKLIGYERISATDGWNQNVLLAADNDSDFESVSDHLSTLFSSDYTINKIYLSKYSSTSQATSDIKNRINSGALITNYTGHGNKTVWAGEYLFQLSDIVSLNNASKLTWAVSFTCLDGYFPHPIDGFCLAEGWVGSTSNGAVAAFANTAYGYPSEQKWLGDALYRTVFEKKHRILGQASTNAKIMAYSGYGISADYLKTYTLFGDPASKLNAVNYASVTLDAPNGGETWAGKHNILWMATDSGQIGSGALSAILYYSHTSSGPWTMIAGGLACTSGIQAGYTWDTASIASGTYFIRVMISGSIGSGEDVSDASFRITRDHTPPAAPVVSSSTHPSQTAWYNNNTPAFNWTVSDESGISGYNWVLDHNALTLPARILKSTAITTTCSPQTDGIWYFHVRAKDEAGNWGPAGHYKIQIDTVAPAAPQVKSSTHSKQTVWYNNNSPVFSWTPPADKSEIGGYSYILDQTSLTTPDTIIEGTALATRYTGVADGTWYLHIRARDGAGNWGAATHFTINIDTVIPSAPIVTSSTHPVQETWYSNSAPAFSWIESTAGITNYSYILDQKSTTIPYTASGRKTTSNTTATASYTGRANGIWYFHVQAKHGANNWGIPAHYTVRIDTTRPPAPHVGSSTHPNQNVWCSNNNPIFSWTPPSDLSGIGGYNFALDQISATVPSAVNQGTAVTSGYTVQPDGIRYFHVRSVDNAGNWGTTRHYRLKIDATAPGVPTVSSSTHPDQNATYTNNNPAFKWNASDAASGIAGYSYILNQTSDTIPDTINMGTATGKIYSHAVNGIWYFHVRAVDKAGNWGAAGHYTIHINH